MKFWMSINSNTQNLDPIGLVVLQKFIGYKQISENKKKHQSNIVCYIWEYENMRIPRKIIYKNLDWMSPHLQTPGGKLDFSNDFCLLYLIYFSTVSTVFVKKNIFYSSIYISISLGLLHDICLYWFFMRKMFIFSLQLSLKSCKSWNKLLKI